MGYFNVENTPLSSYGLVGDSVDVDVTTVAASNTDHLLAPNYVTIIVVIVAIVIIMALVVALAVYKNYRTWAASTRTTRRRHSSQHQWLYPDTPEMWDETLDGDGEI